MSRSQSVRVPVLRVNGVNYTGWKSVEMQNSLDQLVGAFGARVAFKDGIDIAIGDKYELVLAAPDGLDSSAPLASGWIDGLEINYTGSSHDITISGRDKACDLVDCSVVASDYPASWRNATLAAILNAVCAPFEIEVFFDTTAADAAAARIRYARAEEGDTIVQLINKLCATQAVLPISLGDGRLTITRAGAVLSGDRLSLGYNIKSGSLRADDSGRFGKYVVKGQSSGQNEWGQSVTWQFKGSATDVLIEGQRRRQTVVTSQDARNTTEATNEAAWLAAQRAGKARAYEYELSGWEQEDGSRVPWQLNSLVRVADSILGLDDALLLISAVDRSYDVDGGMKTKLQLVEPDAYRLRRVPLRFPPTNADRSW